MGRTSIPALTAFALAWGLGCGSSTPTDPAGAKPTPFTEEAIRTASILFDTKLCAAMAQCDPIVLERLHDGLEACIGRDRPLTELASRFGYGSILTPDSLRACADALDLSTCKAYADFQLGGIAPEPCRPLQVGSLPDGGACKSGNQCASGRCYVSPEPPESCGHCAPRLSPGAPCAGDLACEPGSTCAGQGADARCTKLGVLGDACHPQNRPCHPTLVCSDICVTPVIDNRCDPGVGCSALPGLRYCNPETRTCDPLVLANVGESCGPRTAAPYFVQCARGAACSRARSASPTLPQYACVLLIEDGGACDPGKTFFSPCRRQSSVCAGNICRKSGPAECSAPDVLP